MFRTHGTSVRRGIRVALAAALLLLLPQELRAQTVIDARVAEFTPSSNHDDLGADGSQVVTTYRLHIYRVGSTSIEQTVDLGKPTPQSDGKIRVDFVARLATPLTPGVDFQSRVAAVGPGGSGVSDLSNTFTYSAPCAPSLSSTSAAVSGAGGSGTVNLTVASGCTWTATSNAPWLAITSGAGGTGNGTIAFAAAASTATTSRSGTLTIAGLTFTVTQAAACAYAISPNSQSVTALAQSTTVSVTAGAGCGWTATTNVSWLTVSSNDSGTGNGSVTLAVAAHTASTSRSGTATIAGHSFTVTQAAACTYSIDPSSQSVDANAQSITMSLSTAPGCGWTATSNASWLTVSSGASGAGAGSVTVAVAANSATTARTGTVTIGGQTFTLNQAGVPCTYSVVPDTITAPADGISGTLAVSTLGSCTWTANGLPSWMTAQGGTRTGSGSWAFTVKANTGVTSRTVVITVAGRAVNVVQDGIPVAPTAPANLKIVAEGNP